MKTARLIGPFPPNSPARAIRGSRLPSPGLTTPRRLRVARQICLLDGAALKSVSTRREGGRQPPSLHRDGIGRLATELLSVSPSCPCAVFSATGPGVWSFRDTLPRRARARPPGMAQRVRTLLYGASDVAASALQPRLAHNFCSRSPGVPDPAHLPGLKCGPRDWRAT